jgi:hypothetical protein
VTKRQAENQETIRTSADQFIADVRKRLLQYEASEVINTDQSRIQLELYSTRTLSHKGEKVTIGSVRSINATTYSYTVQPTIARSFYLSRTVREDRHMERGYTIIFPVAQDLKHRRKQWIKFSH